jgi:putative transposase
MRRSRFSSDEIMSLLDRAQHAESLDEFCKSHGLSISLLYRWRRRYGGLQQGGIERIRALEDENRRLNKIIALLNAQLHSLGGDSRDYAYMSESGDQADSAQASATDPTA